MTHVQICMVKLNQYCILTIHLKLNFLPGTIVPYQQPNRTSIRQHQFVGNNKILIA